MQYLNIKKYTVTDNFADTVQIDLDFLTLSRFFLHIPQHGVHHFSVMFVAKCTVNDKAGTGCECKSLSVSCVNRYVEHIVLRFQKIYKCRSDTFVLIFWIDEKPRYSVILRHTGKSDNLAVNDVNKIFFAVYVFFFYKIVMCFPKVFFNK